MAVLTARRRRDPEGRMALREHLYELRRRLVRSALAIFAGAIAGWFLYDWVFAALVRPIRVIQLERGAAAASLNFVDPAGPFNLKVQLAILTGVVLASPVWLYQFWAFITPGLTPPPAPPGGGALLRGRCGACRPRFPPAAGRSPGGCCLRRWSSSTPSC